VTVVVVVQEGGAGAVVGPRLPVRVAAQAGRDGDIDKAPAPLAVTDVVVEDVGPAIAGDEQVRIAVVVDIADSHALAAADVAQAGLGRHVAKLAAAQVLEQLARRRVLGIWRQEARALHHEEIEQPVLVVVNPGETGAGLVHDVLHVAAAVEVLEVDPGRSGDVDEVDVDSRRKLEFGLSRGVARYLRHRGSGFAVGSARGILVSMGRQPDHDAKGGGCTKNQAGSDHTAKHPLDLYKRQVLSSMCGKKTASRRASGGRNVQMALSSSCVIPE